MSAAQSHLENLPRGLQVALALGLVALAAFPSSPPTSTRRWWRA